MDYSLLRMEACYVHSWQFLRKPVQKVKGKFFHTPQPGLLKSFHKYYSYVFISLIKMVTGVVKCEIKQTCKMNGADQQLESRITSQKCNSQQSFSFCNISVWRLPDESPWTKTLQKKRIAESSEDCWTNRSCEKFLQYSVSVQSSVRGYGCWGTGLTKILRIFMFLSLWDIHVLQLVSWWIHLIS